MYYNQELGLCIEFGPVRVDSVRGGGPPTRWIKSPLRRFTPSWTSTRVTCDCLLPFVHSLLSQVDLPCRSMWTWSVGVFLVSRLVHSSPPHPKGSFLGSVFRACDLHGRPSPRFRLHGSQPGRVAVRHRSDPAGPEPGIDLRRETGSSGSTGSRSRPPWQVPLGRGGGASCGEGDQVCF